MTRSHARLAVLLFFCAALTAGCAGRVNDDVWAPLARWSASTFVGRAIAESRWQFAVIESVHLVGLSLLGGAVLLVDFSLIGLALSDEPLQKLSRSADPWLLTGLLITLLSGFMLYLSEATKFYSVGFWDSAEAPFICKMLFLLLAILFTATIRRTVLSSSIRSGVKPSMRDRIVGITSLFLWLCVGAAGRGIGFY